LAGESEFEKLGRLASYIGGRALRGQLNFERAKAVSAQNILSAQLPDITGHELCPESPAFNADFVTRSDDTEAGEPEAIHRLACEGAEVL
jgi:hypothetical protein